MVVRREFGRRSDAPFGCHGCSPRRHFEAEGRGLEMTNRKMILKGLCALVLMVLSASVVWGQERNPSVAVAPFAVHGGQEPSRVQRSLEELFVRRLSKEGAKVVETDAVVRVAGTDAPGNDEQARSLGRKLSADFVLIGSCNAIGAGVSLDARLVDTTGRKESVVLFAEEKGMENLAGAVDRIVQGTAGQLLSKAIVADIRVSGNDRIEPDAVKQNIKSKKGELLRPEQVREDIKTIFKTGFFKTVDADVSDSPAGKVLTFVVQENPTVQELHVKGNKKIKEKDILAGIATKSYTILQQNIISDDIQKIKKLYQTKGYFNAEVDVQTVFPKDPRRAIVTFDIKENKQYFIKKITFRGNHEVSARSLRGAMQTKTRDTFSWLTDTGILQKEVLDTDVDRLTVHYHDMGYMDAKVGTPEVKRGEDGFHIEIPVEEGERYKVTDVKLKGDIPAIGEAQAMKGLGIKKGEYFGREKLRSDIEKLGKMCMDEGYAHADVNPNVDRDPSGKSASVVYEIRKKMKVHIGKVFISGNTKTRDNVIRRELKLAEGDLFSSTKLEKSTNALKKLDFFEEVSINPIETSDPEVMDLHIKVKEKMTGSISAGGGYSSDDGLFASGEINQKNLFGEGDYIGLKAYLGTRAHRYMLSYTDPRVNDLPFSAGFDIYNWLKQYTDFTEDSIGFKLRSAYLFGDYSRLTMFYTLEDSNLTNVSNNSDAYWKSQVGHHLKSSITAGVERDTTDHPYMPTKGSVNSLKIEFASRVLGSESDFVKGDYHAGYYFPIYEKLIGFARGEVGAIVPLTHDSDTAVPVYDRFFLGGINSLRAFKWGDIGPKDTAGSTIGGFTYAIANVEALFPLMEKFGIRGVVFFDAGNAYAQGEPIDISKFRPDAGAGVRWNSPFGPLRIEYGYNLDRQPGESMGRIQFSAGAFF